MSALQFTMAAGMVLASAAVWRAAAEESAAPGPREEPQQGVGQTTPKRVLQLQAEWHRTTADLIEAKAAQKLDEKKIAELTAKLQSLKKQIEAERQEPAPAKRPHGGPGWGHGRRARWRHGRGPGHGRGGQWADPAFQQDREWFHFLLDNGSRIRRSITKRDDGVETVTESNDPNVASVIRKHVASMHERLKQGRPIRMRDPLFAALFANSAKITMQVKPTERGVRVIETSTEPHVARLIQAHAEVVSLFIANGRAEARKNHAAPQP
jgi:hypothetical protein